MFGRNAFCAVAGPMFASQPATTMNAKAIDHVLRVRCTEIAPENYLNLIYTRMAPCPLMALSGHGLMHCTCPLSGIKRTCRCTSVLTRVSAFVLRLQTFDLYQRGNVRSRRVGVKHP